MKRDKVIYTAGPIRGNSQWGDRWALHRNIEMAKCFARKLWMRGWAVICPQANTEDMDGSDIDGKGIFLDGDLVLIDRCDAVLMLPGWKNSEGAKGEYAYAVATGKTVYMDLSDVPDLTVS